MLKLIGFRLALAVPQLAIVSLLIFSLTYLIPGSAAAAILGEAGANPAEIARLEAQLGLDKPFIVGLLDWYAGALTGDFGNSVITGRPVADLVFGRLPATLSLVAGGLIVAAVVGMALGIFAGVRAGQPRDRVVTGVTAFLQSVPEFWAAQILIVVLVIQLRVASVISWVPPQQDLGRWFAGLVLPALTLGVFASGLIARQTRSAMATALASPYADMLTVAGHSRSRVVFKYGLKNALIPALASIGLAGGVLFGTSLVIEKVFGFPGLGTLLANAVVTKDIPIVQGVALVIAVIIILAYLVLDIVYGIINPKVRPS